jgi:hypothetical protein
MDRRNIGSTLDSLFEELGELEEINLLAQKKIIVRDLLDGMRRKHLSKATLASRMRTSRAQLDRLLDLANTSVTLATLAKAAAALALLLEVRLAPERARRRARRRVTRTDARGPIGHVDAPI